jgi:hypothetical protein
VYVQRCVRHDEDRRKWIIEQTTLTSNHNGLASLLEAFDFAQQHRENAASGLVHVVSAGRGQAVCW